MPRWDSCILANCSKTRRNKTICNRLKKKYVKKGIDAFKHGNQGKDRKWYLFEFQHFCKSSNTNQEKAMSTFPIRKSITLRWVIPFLDESFLSREITNLGD